MNIREALAGGAATLESERIPSPRLTAEVLLAHCLRRDRVFLHTHPDFPIDADRSEAFLRMIGRRLGREPLQYITGTQEFYGRPFHVDPTVLIPRPETELVVDAVVELNRWPMPRILDVGTGSGGLAATLALEVAGSRVFASDVSLEALVTARRNARANRAHVDFAAADLLDGWSGPFEFIVSNPPYIAREESEGLPKDVLGFEPHVALFGDRHPQDTYARLVSGAAARLIEGGWLVLEIGYTMEGLVRALFDLRWRLESTRCDLQGIPRVVAARWAGSSGESGSGGANSGPTA